VLSPCPAQCAPRAAVGFPTNNAPHVLHTDLDVEVVLKNDPRMTYIGGWGHLMVQIKWDLDPDNFFLRDLFFLDFFFGDRSLRTGPPPSPRVEFHSGSSYYCVNYT